LISDEKILKKLKSKKREKKKKNVELKGFWHAFLGIEKSTNMMT
jgi:hypothetical protein